MIQGEGVHSPTAPIPSLTGSQAGVWGCVWKKRGIVCSCPVECESSWAWLPPTGPQGATTKHSTLPRLTPCRVFTVRPPQSGTPRGWPRELGSPTVTPKTPQRRQRLPCPPQPTHPYFARQEALRLGHNWSRCLLLWVGVGDTHWTNQGSRVCCPIQSDERCSLSPFPGDGWVLGFSGVSWLSGVESQHSSSKEARERA